MTLLVNFVSMSVHLRSAKEGPSIMRRTCICRGNEQQSLLLPRVSCPCSSHAEDEYAASRAAKAGSCLVPALVSLSVQIFPTESFIGPYTLPYARRQRRCPSRGTSTRPR